MAKQNTWLLPDGVDESLPQQAQILEHGRRWVLDTFASNGYQLVRPPLIEFIDSLLTGAGNDLDLLTFKVTDQNSGRLMGVRADMTPQLSRIDAHVLKACGVNRLCYLGPVLQTAARSGFHSREPIQFGAELFGNSEVEADVEVVRLCTETLNALGIKDLLIDLGHVGIFQALMTQAQFDDASVSRLLDIFQRKSWPDLNEFIETSEIDEALAQILLGLMSLEGDAKTVLADAERLFSSCSAEVIEQLTRFKQLVSLIEVHCPCLTINLDFLELRGINYHTGAVFSIYQSQHSHAIAKGGRYDDVGLAFGQARAATGFSADLKQCMNLSTLSIEKTEKILAPFNSDPSLSELIKTLKAQGKQVVVGLQNDCLEDFDRQIVADNGQWQVIDINQ